MADQPKLLIIDIETMAAKGWFWRIFKENIGIEQIESPPRILCIGAKWLGSKETMFFSEWEHGHDAMLEIIRDLLMEADAVIHFNGEKFDIPHIRTEFIISEIGSLPKLTQIDLQKIARSQFRFISNKLAFVGPLLKCGEKIKTEGFELWRGVEDGDEKCQRKMERYCKQDVRLTEELYKRMKPYIPNHPTFRHKYHNCSADHTQKRGFRYTATMKIQRLFCKSCRGWYDGKKEKLI